MDFFNRGKQWDFLAIVYYKFDIRQRIFFLNKYLKIDDDHGFSSDSSDSEN